MHILNRCAVVTVLCFALVPLGTYALVSFADRTEVEEELRRALEEAQATYRRRTGLSAARSQSQRVLEQSGERLTAVAQRKRTVRLQVAALLSLVQRLQNEADELILEQERASTLFSRERERFRTFVLYLYHRQQTLTSTGPRVGGVVLRRMLRSSLGEGVAEGLRQRAVRRTQEHLLHLLLSARDSAKLTEARLREFAGDIAEDLISLQEEHRDLQGEYLGLLQKTDQMQRSIVLSEEELAEIKQTVAEVHGNVLAMQSELSRIDARLKQRAEHALVEMGLRDPGSGPGDSGPSFGPLFTWPVYGAISAGFLDPDYPKVFGVPHHGMDIVVGQGTPVASAADGVVLLVREGGERGYTYVLVGHEGGFATLYGHLSGVSVAAGQEVVRGQIIGLSGGRPGTPGAGLMTTGAHLHFEVIRAGININPAALLP